MNDLRKKSKPNELSIHLIELNHVCLYPSSNISPPIPFKSLTKISQRHIHPWEACNSEGTENFCRADTPQKNWIGSQLITGLADMNHESKEIPTYPRGIYPRPSTHLSMKEILPYLHFGLPGNVPGVCWNFLRMSHPDWFITGSL